MSGVTAGDSQRAELIARILSKAANGTAGPVRGELLSTLLSDTANLTQFIRYSGLSEDVSAALLRDAMSATARPAHLSPRSMGEINDMLSRVRPTTAGVDASYGDVASFGESGSGPSHLSENFFSGKSGGLQFVPFSPGQVDFDRTIDNIGPGSNRDDAPEATFNLIDAPLQKSRWEGARLTREVFYLILASLTVAILLGILTFVG